MFRNGWERHVIAPGQIRHAPVAPSQLRQDAPPGWIRQGGESPIKRFRIIFNHLVKYLARRIGTANKIFKRPAQPLFLIQRLPVTLDSDDDNDESKKRYLPKLETDIDEAVPFQQNAPNNAQKM